MNFCILFNEISVSKNEVYIIAIALTGSCNELSTPSDTKIFSICVSLFKYS